MTLRTSLLPALFFCGLGASEARAEGGSAWAAGASMTPVEQRVAVAASPERTTVWTSLRFEASAGPIGIVVPVPDGAMLDTSTDAWFEALEAATAPRVLPPAGQQAGCPGAVGEANPFEVVGVASHVGTLSPESVALLDDAAAVGAWAAGAGLTPAAATSEALAALEGAHFLAVLFLAPGGAAVTRTLRVVLPAGPAVLPLAMTRAGGADLLVTAWLVGEGAANLVGGTPVALSPGSLLWSASAEASNYRQLRAAVLASNEPGGVLLEGTGHESWSEGWPIVAGALTSPVATAYFERAAAYDAMVLDPDACAGRAGLALDSGATVALACPRAELGVVGDGPACVEAPGPGMLDPALLACGGSADDLAVAFSGLTPASTLLTRQTLLIAAGGAGNDWPLSFGASAPESPVLAADGIELTGCLFGGGGGGGTTSSGGSSGPGRQQGPTGSGSIQGTYQDGNQGDDSDDATEDASLDSGGCDSSSGSSDSSGSDAGGGCDGGGDAGGGCDGGDAGDIGDIDCEIHGRAQRPTRGSIVGLCALALLAPLRRRSRAPRRPGGGGLSAGARAA